MIKYPLPEEHLGGNSTPATPLHGTSRADGAAEIFRAASTSPILLTYLQSGSDEAFSSPMTTGRLAFFALMPRQSSRRPGLSGAGCPPLTRGRGCPALTLRRGGDLLPHLSCPNLSRSGGES